MLTTLVTHSILAVVCFGGGWWAKGKFGVKAGAIVTDVKAAAADLKK